MLRLAELADEGPFGAVWVNDSLVDTPGFDPLVSLGAVAARTRRVRLGTGILQPHFRNPFLLGLAWASLDQAAQGRTILGLAIGGGSPDNIAKECALVGITSRERGQILEATVATVRALWRDEHPEMSLPVRPVQAHVPIWIAAGIYVPQNRGAGAQGSVESAHRGRYLSGRLERVARLADGWFTLMATPTEVRESLVILHEEAARYGRSPDQIVPCLELWINVGPDRKASYRELRRTVHRYFEGAEIPDETIERWAIWGPADACLERLAEFETAGIRHVKLVIGSSDPFEQLERISTEIAARPSLTGSLGAPRG
jgi:alkanesulfonate monooxygenase SsuD/methylene tetrahydromethanopterin reductase-like flavin-dependent oxidoreductase (luciferase family)